MALSDFYDQIDQALQKLSEALDLLEQIPPEEVEMGKAEEFEDLIHQIDEAAVGLEELAELGESEEEATQDDDDVVDAEFRRVR